MKVYEALQKMKDCPDFAINPVTGSILFMGEIPDIDAVEQHTQSQNLFTFQSDQSKQPKPLSLAKEVAAPVGAVNKLLNTVSGGSISLAGLAFIALISVGIMQIIRGDFGAMPWYTAFWYAFGMFTKSIAYPK